MTGRNPQNLNQRRTVEPHSAARSNDPSLGRRFTSPLKSFRLASGPHDDFAILDFAPEFISSIRLPVLYFCLHLFALFKFGCGSAALGIPRFDPELPSPLLHFLLLITSASISTNVQ